MKQFEKWFEETYPRGREHKDYKEIKEITSIGWKAALKWVKTLPSSGTYKFTEPMRFIKKELEE